MKNKEQYDIWNALRRERFPNANHSAWSSEQCFKSERGHELVADYAKNWVQEYDEEK